MNQDPDFVTRLQYAVDTARALRTDMYDQLQRMRATMERIRERREARIPGRDEFGPTSVPSS